ncbi:MAG: patatin-like phospholipase family protein [Candidatus Cloacimonadaceae bacterium]
MQTAKLVLSGGAALGLAEIGVLQVLQENFDITSVIGTSMGSIVGGLYAKGLSPDEILDIAYQYKKSDIFNPFNLDIQLSGIFDGKGVLKQLEEWTDNILIENCRMPFCAVAFDLNRRNSILIDKGPLAKAMRASASVPYLFSPFQWDKYVFVDGGIEYPLPLALAADLPGELTIAVNVLPNTSPSAESITLDGKKHKTEKIRLHEVVLCSLTQNQAWLALQSILDGKPDIVIDACRPEGSFFGFDEADAFYHYGTEAARKALKEYDEPNYLEKLHKKYQNVLSRFYRGLNVSSD